MYHRRRPLILMDGKKRLSRAAMLVLLGALSIFISGASTFCWEDLLLRRRMTVKTQKNNIAADMDAAIMIVILRTPKKDQTNNRQKKKISLMGAENGMYGLIEYHWRAQETKIQFQTHLDCKKHLHLVCY